MFLRAWVAKKAVASESARPAHPFSNSHSLSAITSLRFSLPRRLEAGTKTSTTTRMITAGAARLTIATMPVEIDSDTNGYEMERSSSEKGRLYDETRLNPPPAAAIAL